MKYYALLKTKIRRYITLKLLNYYIQIITSEINSLTVKNFYLRPKLFDQLEKAVFVRDLIKGGGKHGSN
jgi:hypothetical protein